MLIVLSQCGQPGHISRDCTNPASEGAGRGGGFGGQGGGGGGNQECYKVSLPSEAMLPELTFVV
jgi:cellular nucleic acid-binding protein